MPGFQSREGRAIEIREVDRPSRLFQRLHQAFDRGNRVCGGLERPIGLVVGEESAEGGGPASGHSAQPVEVGHRFIRAEELRGQRWPGRVFLRKLGQFPGDRFRQVVGDVTGGRIVVIGTESCEGAFGIHRGSPVDGDSRRAAAIIRVGGIRPRLAAQRGAHHRFEGRRQHPAAHRAHQVHPQEQVGSPVPVGDRERLLHALHGLDVCGVLEASFQVGDDFLADWVGVARQQEESSGVGGCVLWRHR